MVGVRLARPLCLGYFASCTRVAAKLRSHETQPAQDSTVVNDDASFSPEASAEDGRGTFLQGPWHDPNSFKSPHAFTDQENAFDNFGFNPRYSSGDYWEGYEQRKSFKDKQKKHRRFQERRRRAFEMAAILGDAGGPLPSEVAKTLMGDRVDGEYDEYPGCMCGYEYVRVKAPPFAFRAPSAIADSKAATRAYSNLLNYICGDQVVQVAYVARVLTEVQLFALGKTSPGDIFYADPWNQISDPIGINEKICHTPTRGAYEHGAETAAARVRGMTPEEREAEAVKIARAAYGWKFSGIHEEKGERNNTQQIRDFREGMKEYGDWVDGQMDKYIKRLVKRAQKEMEGRKTESVAPAKRTGESTEGEDEKPEKDKQEEQPNEASKSKKTKSDTDSDAGALFGGSAASASFLTTQLGGPKNWEDGKIPDEVSQQNTDLIELSLRAPPVEGFDWNQEKDSLQEDIEGIQKRHNETCTLDIFYMAILSRTMDLLQEFTLIPEDDKAHS